MERRALSLAVPVAWTTTSGRLVIAFCAVALVAAALLTSAQPAAAVDLGDRIAAVRAAQRSAESIMRQQDQAISRLDAQRKVLKKQLKPLERAVQQRRSELAQIKSLREENNMPLSRIREIMEKTPSENADDPAAESVEYREREARIMDAAIRLFSEKGYEKATISDIADASRMSKSTFYLHFANKKDLFLRCFSRMLERFW